MSLSLEDLPQNSEEVEDQKSLSQETLEVDRACEGEKLQDLSSLREEIRFLFGFFTVALVLVLSLFLIYRAVWIPLILGLLAAYVLDPFVAFFSTRTKLPRPAVVLGAMGGLALVLTVVVVLVLPAVKSQAMEIIKILPATYDTLVKVGLPYAQDLQYWLYSLGLSSSTELNMASLSSVFSLDDMSSAVQNTLSTLWSSLPGIISFMVGILLIPCIMYLGLQYSPQMHSNVMQLVPNKHHGALKDIFRRLSRTLRGVIVGQLYVALTLGILYTVGYSLLGLKGAVAIGLAAGLGRLIPYMDMVIALVLSTAVILASDVVPWTPLLGSVMIIVIVSIIDAMIVTPRLIGSSAGVHPILVICSIIAFSALLGFWGVVIAVPVVALLKELFLVVIDYYKKWKNHQDHDSEFQ